MELLRHIKPIVLLLCLAAAAASCTREVTESGGEEMEVTFVLKTRRASTATRATIDNENHINTVEVLVFEAGNGAYLYTANGTDISNAGSETKSFSVKLRADKPNVTYDLIVLANSRPHIQRSFNGGIPAKTPRTTVFNTLMAQQATKWEPDPDVNGFLYMPMWGEITDVGINDSMSSDPLEVDMVRLMARVDISVAPGAGDFTVKEAWLYNYNSAGLLIPEHWSGSVITAPTLPGASFLTVGPLEVGKQNMALTPGQSLQNEIYIFEAAAGTENELSNTCLVVGGEYKGIMGYYRIDFETVSGTSAFVPVKRNFVYGVQIRSVSGPGFPDKEKAYRSQKYGMEYEVRQWEDGYESEYGSGKEYRLDISSTLINVGADPTPANPYQVTIMTTHPDGWEYKLSTSATQVTGNVNWITNITLSDEPLQNIPVRLSFEAGYNTPNIRRDAYIHIISGNLTNVITVRQYPL